MYNLDSWYEPPCEKYDPKDDIIYECKEIVKDIIRQLYSSDSIDYKALQYDIEELCQVLHIKQPHNYLTIERKKKDVHKNFFSTLDMFAVLTK